MRVAGAEGELEPALQRRHLLRIAPVGVVVGFDQPRLSNLVARKLVEAPILTVTSPAISNAMASPRTRANSIGIAACSFLIPIRANTKRSLPCGLISGAQAAAG